MTVDQFNVPPAVHEAFASFISNVSLLALPLTFETDQLRALQPVKAKDADPLSQHRLDILDDILNPHNPLYLLLRRNNSVHAITFVPYRAPKDEQKLYLNHRHDLVKSLGETHFETSLICKEIGEITDKRSWVERDEHQHVNGISEATNVCGDLHEQTASVKDVGYKKNKCRLCDRRMKNKITPSALEALKTLSNEGSCVQISLDADLVLTLTLQIPSLPPNLVSFHLPTTRPTFTLYRHSNTLLYFIFHSPDSATVQQRMKHTMAIPGLVNVHAEDCGVHVDQKIEIHEPQDLVFEEGDERMGKFRSMYLRGEWEGTESRYEGLERDGAFYDAIR